MTRNEVMAKLQEIFDDVFVDPVQVVPTLSAKDVDEWDSLIQISLVISVERKFSIRFRVGEVEKTKNVDEFVTLILGRLEQK